jgi:putative ABC transport system permease protein
MQWAAVRRETGTGYLSTEPASATIKLAEGLDPGRMAAIADQAADRPQVLAATGRTQFDGQVEVNGQPLAVPLQVFVAAPDEPMRMVRFDLRQPGAWPPAPGEIWLGDDDTLGLLGAAVGDTLTVTPPGGEPVRLRVAGTVYDPSLAPSRQEQRGHGYLSTVSLGARSTLDQLKIQVADPAGTEPSRDRDTVVRVANDVASWLRDAYGLTITEIQVPKPYAHPHQWQFTVLLLSLLTGGAATVLLAAVLAATLLNTLLSQQIPQIGILKAIGARSGRIARQYLRMILLVAVAATALALVPAALIARGGVRSLLGIVGIQPASLAPPWWAYAIMVAVGISLPPLLALIPLVKASRTTVRAAIDHSGASGKAGAAAGLLTRLSRLRRLNRGLLMAVRNTVRRPARFWLSVGLLGSAGMVFVAGMSVRSGAQAAEDAKAAQRYWDVEVRLAESARADAVTAALTRVPGVRDVETWTRTQISIAGPGQAFPVSRTYPDQGHGSVSINTLPADPIAARPPLRDGRWPTSAEAGAVVLGQAARIGPGVDVGDTVRLFIDGKASTWRVVGTTDEGESASGAYTTAVGYAAATGQSGQVNMVRLVTDRHDEQSRQAVAATADQALTAAGATVEVAASVSRTETASTGHAGPVLTVLLAVALPLGLLGGIGLASTMGANVLERIREFAVMHAIGAARRRSGGSSSPKASCWPSPAACSPHSRPWD